MSGAGLTHVFDTLVEGICIIDAQYEIEYVNPALERQFGPVEGRKCYQYLRRAETSCADCDTSQSLPGRCTRMQPLLRDGRTYEVFMAAVQHAGGTASLLEIYRDTLPQQLAQKVNESEQTLRALSFSILSAQEMERRRISKELHDVLGQALTVMKLRLGLIKRGLLESQQQLKAECDATMLYIDQVIENTRRMSRELSPSILEGLGLTAALKRLVEEFARTRKLEARLDLERVDDLIVENARIVIYRIFQEILTNVEKHAAATKISVGIRRSASRVEFRVEDDGKGFDCARAFESGKGLGLATMKELVAMLGGTLQVESRPGRGTAVSFSVSGEAAR
jgi:signal transduction histidine kinase